MTDPSVQEWGADRTQWALNKWPPPPVPRLPRAPLWTSSSLPLKKIKACIWPAASRMGSGHSHRHPVLPVSPSHLRALASGGRPVFSSEGLSADSLALHAGVCLGYQHQPGSGSVRLPSPPGVPSQGVGPGPELACPGVCTGPKSEEASTGPGAASCKGQDLRSQRPKESARDRRAGGPLKLWGPREAQLHRIRESRELTSPKPRIRREGYQRSIWVDRTTGRCKWERPCAEKQARAGSGGAGEGTRPAVCPEPGAAVKSWRFGLGSLGPSGADPVRARRCTSSSSSCSAHTGRSSPTRCRCRRRRCHPVRYPHRRCSRAEPNRAEQRRPVPENRRE